MPSSNKLLWAALLATTVLSSPSWALAQVPEAPPTEPEDAASVTDEIVVRGRFIPNEKRVTSEISNLLTAEDLQRTGDAEVSEALARVTGLSLVGDGFVYVRGLGERYSSALLDGSTLPSPEPLRRVVPLDVFPSALLSGALVQKTYSVEYPAEFGGGVIVLRTKAVPDRAFFEAGVSTGFNTESTLETGLSWDSGNRSWLGFSDRGMQLPKQIKVDPSLQSFDAVSLQAAGRSFRPNWSLDRQKIPFDGGLTVAGGNAFDIGEMRAGVLASVDYSSEVRNRNGVRRTFSVSDAGLVTNDQFDQDACRDEDGQVEPGVIVDSCGLFRTDWDVRLNAIASFGLEINADHELTYTTLLLRKTTQQGEIARGSFAADPGTVRSGQRLAYIEQQLVTHQVSGEHEFTLPGAFPELDVDWRAAFSRADRDTPYTRETLYDLSADGVFRLQATDRGNRTIFSALEDENFEVGIDFSLNGDLLGRETLLQFGGLYVERDREVAARRYTFAFPAGDTSELREQVPEIIFAPDNVGPPGGLILRDNTDPSDFYTAGFEIGGLYLSSEMQITPTVRWTVGARYEDSIQEVNSFEPQAGTPIETKLKLQKVLPASTLTWEFADNWQARVGYSQTLSRPDLRELSPTQFRDEETGRLERGNPNLRITQIENWDARVEYYFGDRQSATLGVFYKDFKRPIERTFSLLGEEPLRSFANADRAELFGVEAEFDVTLPFDMWFSDVGFVQSRRFFVIGNATYIDAEIELNPSAATEQQTDTNRKLQGQSEYLGNLQFGYDSDELRERAALLLNYTGERIFDVGLGGAPNVIEEPPIQLDLVFAKGFEIGGREIEFGFKVDNILGEPYSLTQGGRVAEEYEIGTTFSFGVTARF
jgi:outer membrane receptor protein involved in Fe transport